MFEIVSGNIAVDVKYQVTGTGAIVYNLITVNSGSFFIGIESITTYTIDSGTPLVIEASIYLGQSFGYDSSFYLGLLLDDSTFLGQSFGYDSNFYLGLLPDDSTFLGISLNYDTPDTLHRRIVKKNNRIISNNNRILIVKYYTL